MTTRDRVLQRLELEDAIAAGSGVPPTSATICSVCGAPLTKPKTGRPPTYCSVRCRRLRERAIARRCRAADLAAGARQSFSR
jgi:hypothetical protein